MITAHIALEGIVEQAFEQLMTNKDQHIKILVSPNPKLVEAKRTDQSN